MNALQLEIPRAFRPPAPAVPIAEMHQRLANIRSEMVKAKIDVIVLTDKKNIDYFTDYQELSWDHKARPVFVAISLQDFALFGSLGESRTVEIRPRVFDPVYYNGYLDEAVTATVDWIKARTATRTAHIAVDYGQDMFGRGSLRLIEELSSLDACGRIKSATDPIWRVRMIKSRFEADLNRTAYEIVDAAFNQTIRYAYIGMTEYELYYLMQAQTYLNGAESAEPIATLFSKGDFAYARTAKERKLEEGHYIWTDFRATYGGYPADCNRIARAGEPADWEISTYAAVRFLTLKLASEIRPGLSCSDIYGRFDQLWRAADLGSRYCAVSRIGHGGGMDVTEPPSLSAADKTVIEPGMVLHIEPKLERDGAVFQFEEVVFVTESGVEFLSMLSPETLPVIR
ncbi:Xaa-Pro peptidase family protein [Paraburkholderia caribensis]|uniref:Peptidase M24 n=2 Tax=Paraburkholderia TaxID=1822464 RepID=B2JXT4_PARP8|nr:MULTISPECIES: Xaa-Pro peptidase family protein [Paraburkholderia]ACC76442.1 peptidase M24 [Paraburkholderia phymatum STM815]MCO4879395.1 Xaa-Pro peptidase family protein [Paraburkholderia caribensis]PTB24571.1 aminopeptidase P family protein [Paraburkholderia caribensis]